MRIRTSKNINGALHTYTLSGSTILTEEFSGYLFIYLYDEAGEPIGLQYRKTTDAANVFNCYLFEKNLQGDIVGIYNTSGTKLATYTYDAWGVMTVSVTSGITTTDRLAAVLNPFRYRGYYFDSETGLYYLNSRYYNPNWGRFVNADGIAFLGTNEGLTLYNLYTYCSNNPINSKDASGDFLCTAIGAVVGFGFGALTAWIEGKSGREILASGVNGAISGAIAGVAADIIAVNGGSAAVVIIAYAAAGAIGSAAGTLVENKINNKDISSSEVSKDILVSTLWGGAFGALGGAMTGSVTSMMKNVAQRAGAKALSRGITIGYAIKKSIMKEIRDIGSSLLEEGLSNFTSWFTQNSVENIFER